jgi:nucleoside-diphosphate-sugar epimerase
MFDRAALTHAFLGQDAVVNLASALPSTVQFIRRGAWRGNNRVRIAGSTNVVDAALEAGVPRLLQESVSLLYPVRGDAWVDESVPPDEFPASRGNLAAERNAGRFTDSGRSGAVLRFGWFIGPGARHAEQFVTMAHWRVAPTLGAPRSYISSIHLDDAARAVVDALGAPPGTYNIVDNEPLTKIDFADALSQAVGRRAWIRGPGRAAPLFGDRLTSLTRSIRVSNQLFRRTTGWLPRYGSAREAGRPPSPLSRCETTDPREQRTLADRRRTASSRAAATSWMERPPMSPSLPQDSPEGGAPHRAAAPERRS